MGLGQRFSHFEQRLHALVEAALAPTPYSFWGLVFNSSKYRALLRVFIDSEGGVSIDACEKASRLISAELDVANIIEDRYVLEVSSPGINRNLFSLEHFLAYQGSKVILNLYEPIDERKNISGTIVSCGDNDVCVACDDLARDVIVSFANMRRARLNVMT